MMDWRIATGIICAFGVFKDFRPSESYITAYLIDPEWKNLTIDQVNNQVYPVWTYSYLPTLVPVLLLTDFLRYKVVIIFEALSYIATWVLLLWGQGTLLMQLMQFTFGCATSAEVAYYSYIYAAISETHYRRASSFVRASSLTGRFIAALLAQLLLSFGGASYFDLNIISFVNVCICFGIALILPSTRKSFYFEIESKVDTTENSLKTLPSEYVKQGDEEEAMISKDETELTEIVENHSVTEDNTTMDSDERGSMIATEVIEEPVSVRENERNEDASCMEQEKQLISNETRTSNSERVENGDLSDRSNKTQSKKSVHFSTKKKSPKNVPSLEKSVSIKEGLHRMWLDFLAAYKNRKLLLWSVWWSTTTCGKIHMSNYIQSLYEVIRMDHNSAENYNAAVDAVSLAICALASFGIGFVKVNWSKNGELLLFLVDIVLGGLMVVMSQTNDIWVGYGCYLVVRIIFQTTLTIATYQVAVHLSSRCYGLVFGLNTFLALIFETIMTIIVVDKNGLDLDVRKQFVVYGGYFGVLSLLFLTKFFYNCCQTNNSETVVSEAVES